MQAIDMRALRINERVSIAALVELGYAVFTRTWLASNFSGIEQELLTTLCRLFALLIFFFLFREQLKSRKQQNARVLLHPLLFGAICFCFAVPILVGGWRADFTSKIVFALTSVVVASKEEILYRGALQNLLWERLGPWRAILLSNIVFTLYHYGTLSFTAQHVLEWYLCGVILGALYLASGSLLIVIAVHALYDALWALSPFLTHPMPRVAAIVLLLLALNMIAIWPGPHSNRPQTLP